MGLAEYRGFEIGKTVGPATIVIDSQRVRDFVYAVDDFNPWYLAGSPFGEPVAPVPLLTTDDPEFAALQSPGPQDALAAKFEIRALSPICIGERVTLTSRNVNKYVRRGKGFIVRDFEVYSLDRNHLSISSRLTEMVGPSPAEEDAGSSPSPAEPRVFPRESSEPIALKAAPDIRPGAPLRCLTKQVSRKQMFVFSARPGWWTSIHTDPDFARSLGFSDVIAQGLMSAGYISQLCTEFFGERWFSTGSMSVAFVKPVCCGELLTIGGCVSGFGTRPDGGRQLELEVWCKDRIGAVTTVGRAGGAVG